MVVDVRCKRLQECACVRRVTVQLPAVEGQPVAELASDRHRSCGGFALDRDERAELFEDLEYRALRGQLDSERTCD